MSFDTSLRSKTTDGFGMLDLLAALAIVSLVTAALGTGISRIARVRQVHAELGLRALQSRSWGADTLAQSSCSVLPTHILCIHEIDGTTAERSLLRSEQTP